MDFFLLNGDFWWQQKKDVYAIWETNWLLSLLNALRIIKETNYRIMSQLQIKLKIDSALSQSALPSSSSSLVQVELSVLSMMTCTHSFLPYSHTQPSSTHLSILSLSKYLAVCVMKGRLLFFVIHSACATLLNKMRLLWATAWTCPLLIPKYGPCLTFSHTEIDWLPQTGVLQLRKCGHMKISNQFKNEEINWLLGMKEKSCWHTSRNISFAGTKTGFAHWRPDLD